VDKKQIDEVKDVEITKVVVKMGETEVGLSINQARELLEALSDLLGEEKGETVYIPQPYPVYPYTRPHWEYVQPWITYSDNTQYCSGTVTYNLTDTSRTK